MTSIYLQKITKFKNDLVHLIYPSICIICENELPSHQIFICSFCFSVFIVNFLFLLRLTDGLMIVIVDGSMIVIVINRITIYDSAQFHARIVVKFAKLNRMARHWPARRIRRGQIAVLRTADAAQDRA